MTEQPNSNWAPQYVKWVLEPLNTVSFNPRTQRSLFLFHSWRNWLLDLARITQLLFFTRPCAPIPAPFPAQSSLAHFSVSAPIHWPCGGPLPRASGSFALSSLPAHPLSPAEAWSDDVLSQPCQRQEVCLSPAQETEPAGMNVCLPRWENCHQSCQDVQATWCQPVPLASPPAVAFLSYFRAAGRRKGSAHQGSSTSRHALLCLRQKAGIQLILSF